MQGLSKERTAERLGRDKVMKWRRSFFAKPPAMEPEHPHYSMIEEDKRYDEVSGWGGRYMRSEERSDDLKVFERQDAVASLQPSSPLP